MHTSHRKALVMNMKKDENINLSSLWMLFDHKEHSKTIQVL